MAEISTNLEREPLVGSGTNFEREQSDFIYGYRLTSRKEKNQKRRRIIQASSGEEFFIVGKEGIAIN